MAVSLFTKVFNFVIDYLDEMEELITAYDVETICGYASFDNNKEDIADAVTDWNLMKDIADEVNMYFNLV